MIAIDRMMPGSPPAGFTFARTGRGGEGKWTVVEDPTASVGRAIEQSSTDRTDYRFPLAIHDSLSAANLNVELRFKAVGGEIDQAGGIAVRLEDADNYYVARRQGAFQLNRQNLYASRRGCALDQGRQRHALRPFEDHHAAARERLTCRRCFGTNNDKHRD